MHRRTFLASLGAAALAGACAPRHVAAAMRRERSIGIQLYTLRSEMQRDVAATLARVAEIGYREVEFAGYFGLSPSAVRAALAQHGLTAPASHVPFDRIAKDWPAALDEARAVGHQYVVIPWLQARDLRTADDWKRVAESLTGAGAAARAAGIRLGYHNHDFEFRPVEGRLPFDLLLEHTDPAEVVFELDLYWMVRTGHDPLAYLARHPDRFRLVHVKDSMGAPEHVMADVGAGTIDFARILPAAAAAGVSHFFVEHDQPAEPMASARASFAHLQRLTF